MGGTCGEAEHVAVVDCTACRPEFSDPRFPAGSEGREVTRVQSEGHVTLKLNVTTKGMEAFGFDNGCS